MGKPRKKARKAKRREAEVEYCECCGQEMDPGGECGSCGKRVCSDCFGMGVCCREAADEEVGDQ